MLRTNIEIIFHNEVQAAAFLKALDGHDGDVLLQMECAMAATLDRLPDYEDTSAEGRPWVDLPPNTPAEIRRYVERAA